MLKDLSLKGAVEFAIKTEEVGQKIYQKLAKRFEDNEELHEIFSVLARDEEMHRKQFENLLDKVPEDKAKMGAERFQYLRAMSISAFYRGDGRLSSAVDDIDSREDALERALRLEKDTLHYYQAMKEVLGDNEVLDEIIEVEKSHVQTIVKYLVTEAKVRGVPESVSAEDFR
jgi:rubrerythrin